MICSGKNEAQRRYVIRSWVSAGPVVLLAIGAKFAFRDWNISGPVTYLIAVLPALPIVWMLIATGAYLAEEKDEFQRTVLVQCLPAGIGGTLAITTVWAYLEDFVHAPRLDLILIFPMFWLIAGASYPVVKARYR